MTIRRIINCIRLRVKADERQRKIDLIRDLGDIWSSPSLAIDWDKFDKACKDSKFRLREPESSYRPAYKKGYHD